MWQTKYSSVVPKNLGLGFNFQPCSEGYFFSGRPQSVQKSKDIICQLANRSIDFCLKMDGSDLKIICVLYIFFKIHEFVKFQFSNQYLYKKLQCKRNLIIFMCLQQLNIIKTLFVPMHKTMHRNFNTNLIKIYIFSFFFVTRNLYFIYYKDVQKQF